jgi:hypothetical protein
MTIDNNVFLNVLSVKGSNYERPPADYGQSYNPPAYEPSNYYASEAPYSPPSYTEAPPQSYDVPVHTELPYSPPQLPSFDSPAYAPHAFTEQPSFTEASAFTELPTFSPPTQTEATFPLQEEPSPDQPERNRYPSGPGNQGFFNNNDFPDFDDFFKQMLRG